MDDEDMTHEDSVHASDVLTLIAEEQNRLWNAFTADDEREDDLPPTVPEEALVSGGFLVTGSEPELRECEAVCPVTGYTYNKHLGYSPHERYGK